MRLSNIELAKIYEDISRHPRFVSDDSLNNLAQHINYLDEENERQRAGIENLNARVRVKEIQRAEQINFRDYIVLKGQLYLAQDEIERQRALILEARWLEKNSYAHLDQEALNEFHKRREQWLKDVERGGETKSYIIDDNGNIREGEQSLYEIPKNAREHEHDD